MSELPVLERIGRYKYTEEKDIQKAYEGIEKQIDKEILALSASKEVE